MYTHIYIYATDARAKITSAVTSRLGGSFATKAMQSAAGKAFGF